MNESTLYVAILEDRNAVALDKHIDFNFEEDRDEYLETIWKRIEAKDATLDFIRGTRTGTRTVLWS